MPKEMICDADHSLAGTSSVCCASTLETPTVTYWEGDGDMPSRMRLAIFCITAIVFTSACALTTPAAVQPTWAPESVASAIATRSASAQNAEGAKSYALSVTASCHADEQLIGGGFEATNIFEYALFLRTSYPAHNAWTVKADSISHYALEVFAYCLRGEPSLGAQIVSGNECPAGASPLSHGKAEDGVVTLCAARHVASVTHVLAYVTLTSAFNEYKTQRATMNCPAGTLALDGFAPIGTALSSKATPGFGAWEMTLGGNGAGDVYANCVTLV
jgi:hypothetical protein